MSLRLRYAEFSFIYGRVNLIAEREDNRIQTKKKDPW